MVWFTSIITIMIYENEDACVTVNLDNNKLVDFQFAKLMLSATTRTNVSHCGFIISISVSDILFSDK